MTKRAWSWPLLAAAVVTLTAGCAGHTAPRGDSLSGSSSASTTPASSTTPPTASICAQVSPSVGAASSLGLDGHGVPAPAWSSRLGVVTAAQGGRVLAINAGSCVIAADAASGTAQWSWTPPGKALVMGVLADAQVVLVATGHDVGQAPAAVYPETFRVVALDPATGAQRWAMSIAGDGQTVPAMLEGNRVVLTGSGGNVLGLDAATGTQVWSDKPPRDCASIHRTGQVSPGAVSLPGPTDVVILYQCPIAQELQRLDPVTGAVQWRWPVPRDWGVEYQTQTGQAGSVIGLELSGHGAPLAPAVPGTPQHSNDYTTDDLVAFNADTGTPLWQTDGLSGSAAIYGAAGKLCVASGFGITCYAATTGKTAWRWSPTVAPSHGGPDWSASLALAGRLYTIVPSAAAESIPPGSTTYRAAAGAFELRITEIASGHTVATVPLPSYYGGSDGVVASPNTPPGVLAVSGKDVFISPELHESDVVETVVVPGA